MGTSASPWLEARVEAAAEARSDMMAMHQAAVASLEARWKEVWTGGHCSSRYPPLIVPSHLEWNGTL
jgi:hypothetical protein